MEKGVVKFYNSNKGYGFIIEEKSKDEFFVHASGLSGKRIKEGDVVSFKKETGKKGETAVDVEVLQSF